MPVSTKRRRKDAKSVIGAGRLPERSIDLCLRGDLVSQLQELERELAVAAEEEKVNGSLDSAATRPIAEKMQALRVEMQEHTLTLKLHALPRRKWTALMAAHPPREDDKVDAVTGLNRDTFYDAMVRACVVEPVLDEDDWSGLDEKLSDGQWQALTNAAWAVNARDFDVPFLRRASQILANSETA